MSTPFKNFLLPIMLACLGGCSATASYDAPEYIPSEWLTGEYIDGLMRRLERPAPIGEFESSRQYKTRMKPARNALKVPFEIPVQGDLVAVYDADKERVVLPIEDARLFWSDWKTVNDVSIFDAAAKYPEVTFPMSRDTAKAVFDKQRYRLVLVGPLRDFPSAYLPMNPAVVLVYDASTRRVLAEKAVR